MSKLIISTLITTLIAISVLQIANAKTQVSEQEFRKRVVRDSLYNVVQRRDDGLSVLPISDRENEIAIYSFLVPRNQAVSLSGEAIEEKYVEFLIPENHPEYIDLKSQFHMTPYASSFRILSKSTRQVYLPDGTAFYLKTSRAQSGQSGNSSDVLSLGLAKSKYVQQLFQEDPPEHSDILREQAGFALSIPNHNYAFVKRDYFPLHKALDPDEELVPLTALFGSLDSKNSRLNEAQIAHELAARSGLSYKDWIKNEYAVKFALFLAEMNFKYGLHPAAHLQNTLAVVNAKSGRIVRFAYRDHADFMVDQITPTVFGSLKKTIPDVSSRVKAYLYSNFQGETSGVSQPEIFFKSYGMQSLLLPFGTQFSEEYYQLIIPLLGQFFETYMAQAERILGIDFSSSEKGRFLRSKIAAMKSGLKEYEPFSRIQEYTINFDETRSATNIVIDIYSELSLLTVEKLSVGINFDYSYQIELKKKWLASQVDHKIDYFNYLAEKRLSDLIADREIVFHDDPVRGLLAFRLVNGPKARYPKLFAMIRGTSKYSKCESLF